MIKSRNVEIDASHSGKIGILELLLATGVTNTFEDSVQLILSGNVWMDGVHIKDPTIYPELEVDRKLMITKPYSAGGYSLDDITLRVVSPPKEIEEVKSCPSTNFRAIILIV